MIRAEQRIIPERKTKGATTCGTVPPPNRVTRSRPPWSFPLAFFGSARRLPFPPPPPWPAPGRRSRRRRPRRPRRRRRPSPRRCCWPWYAWWGSPWRCRSATDPPTPASSTPPASTTDTVSDRDLWPLPPLLVETCPFAGLVERGRVGFDGSRDWRSGRDPTVGGVEQWMLPC